MFRKVETRRVRDTWICGADHVDGESTCGKEMTVYPSFYEQGTPVCECGSEMRYAYTEVDIENCLIP
jgi:hypothetical protein